MTRSRGAVKEGGNITILLLGDEGVGKSSLASTFVSRHFSDNVPGILTRVRLPPDPSLSKCTTTIIDTQRGDIALGNALSLSGSTVDNNGSLVASSSIHTSNNNTAADGISSVAKSHGGGEGGVNLDLYKNRQNSSSTSSKNESATGAAQLTSTNPFRNVDAIILLYDLHRIETFHRLTNEWLPLIEQCYNGDPMPVIVAGNKMDSSLSVTTVATTTTTSAPPSNTTTTHPNNDSQHPTRQQIISLLQQFKFVRQCIKCSAKQLLNVDEVFLKAQQSVLYPISPLYNLDEGKLSPACKRAFTRIYRMYMNYNDGLLSDVDLNAFQWKIWGVPLSETDIHGWKEMAIKQHQQHDNDDDVIRNGKFTLEGFLAIFDVLITSQNRLEVPWKVLRTLGYDDELNLNIPASIMSPGYDDGGSGDLEYAYLPPEEWRLTTSDIEFLTSIFLRFDSDGDGILSSTDIHSIFSVLSFPYPPWDERGMTGISSSRLLFQDCFSLPSCIIGYEETFQQFESSSPEEDHDVPFEPDASGDITGPPPNSYASSPSSRLSASGITISSSPLPSVDISKDSGSTSLASPPNHEPLSFLSWINHWHMVCTISPSVARAEMYRLGRNFERKPAMTLGNMSRAGGRVAPCGVPPAVSMPSTVIRALVLGSKDSGKGGLVKKLHGLQHLQANEHEIEFPTTSCSVSKIILPSSSSATTWKGEETLVHVMLAEVPALDMSSDIDKINLGSQLNILLGREKSGKRPYDMVILVFDATNRQSLECAKHLESNVLSEEMPRVYVGTTSASETSSNDADEHCKCMDLEPPLIVCLCEETKLDTSAIEHLVSCARDDGEDVVSFRSTPHGERKRRNAANRRKVLWIGGLVTAGITVVLGMSLTGKRRSVSERGGLLRFLRNVLPF